jgi:hypothetical protein
MQGSVNPDGILLEEDVMVDSKADLDEMAPGSNVSNNTKTESGEMAARWNLFSILKKKSREAETDQKGINRGFQRKIKLMLTSTAAEADLRVLLEKDVNHLSDMITNITEITLDTLRDIQEQFSFYRFGVMLEKTLSFVQ